MTTRWGLIGASAIAREYMIDALREADGEFVSVLSRDAERGAALCAGARHRAALDLPRSVPCRSGDRCGLRFDYERDAQAPRRSPPRGRASTCSAKSRSRSSLEDARAMVDACKRAGVVMGTNHHLRNAGTHRAMRQAIKDGRIGQAARRTGVPCRPFAAASSGLAHHPARGRRRRRARHHRARCRHAALRARRRAGGGRRRDPAAAAWRSAGMEDGVMGVHALPLRRCIAQFHDGFTTKYAVTGFEVHGTEGSLIGAERDDAAARSARSSCATPTASARCRSTAATSMSARSAASTPRCAARARRRRRGEDGVRSLAPASRRSSGSGADRPAASPSITASGADGWPFPDRLPPTRPPRSSRTALSSPSPPRAGSAVPTPCSPRSAAASTRPATPRDLTTLHPIAAGDMWGIKGIDHIAKPGPARAHPWRLLSVRPVLGRAAGDLADDQRATRSPPTTSPPASCSTCTARRRPSGRAC